MKISSNQSNQKFALLVTLIFIAVTGYTAMYHEMWRDEIQAWLIARESDSVIDLLKNLQYEGHPALWHITLMPLTMITCKPEIMQLWSIIIASAVIYLILRYSPFTILQKVLFTFGYFMIYEYSVKSRNYALGWLLFVILCIIYPIRYKRFIWVGVVLMLASHTNILALIVVMAFSAYFLCDLYRIWKRNEFSSNGINHSDIMIGLAFIGIGILTSIIQLIPPPDTGFHTEWHFNIDFQRFKRVVEFLKILVYPMDYNTSNALNVFYPKLQVLASIGISVWFGFHLRHRLELFIFYIMATAGLLCFFYVKYMGNVWHHGYIYMVLFLTAWLERLTRSPLQNRLQKIFCIITDILLALLFAVHVYFGFSMVKLDLLHPFSNGKSAARFIEAANMKDITIIGDRDYAATTIVGYLGIDNIHYVNGNRMGSFIVWDQNWKKNLEIPELVRIERALLFDDKALIVLNWEISDNIVKKCELVQIAAFRGALMDDENFYLYAQVNNPYFHRIHHNQ